VAEHQHTHLSLELKDVARFKVRDAIKRGDLVRPDACEKCGDKPPRGRDGRVLIQGHHADYSKPLEVEWICTKCHCGVTPHGQSRKTHCPKGHPYDAVNTRVSKRGERICRTCNKALEAIRCARENANGGRRVWRPDKRRAYFKNAQGRGPLELEPTP